MMGHISSAYSARVSRDLSLSTRFDFNVYSYESEWTMGAEWWLRRRRSPAAAARPQDGDRDDPVQAKMMHHSNDVHGVVKARASTNNVKFLFVVTTFFR
jgi:distribution and morphology protein 10